jgi:hypothetical protein
LFFIGYCLFEVPANMMLQRLGARIWLTRILFTWGLVLTDGQAWYSPERVGAMSLAD